MKITTLSIEQFRALRQLKIEGLGQVNLITGRNNTGKSSVLEALRILASGGAPYIISSILSYREEDIDESKDSSISAGSAGGAIIASMFSGYPTISKISAPIVISAEGIECPQRLSLSLKPFVERRKQNETDYSLVPYQPLVHSESETIPALFVETELGKTVVNLRRFGRRAQTDIAWLEDIKHPCFFVSSYMSEHSDTLCSLWDKIALSDREQDVLEALRLVVPEIVGVSMIGNGKSRTAIVRTSGIARPVPLRSFGDGLNRLFGIILSLVNAKDGLLLIDEIENGLHYSVQLDVWKTIFRLAKKLNIQVFATSHSWDTIDAFQKSSAEDQEPDSGVLIRLTRRVDEIIPTIFDKNELAIVTCDHFEVR